MNKNNSYLEKFNYQNNTVIKALNVNKSIFIRLLVIICSSLIYLILKAICVSKHFLDIRITYAHTVINVFMNICYVVAVIGIISQICYYLIPSVNNLLNKVKYKTKNIIYNVLDWSSIIAVCATVISFLFAFIFAISFVEGDSMNFTFKDGEAVVINYNKKIERFDVVAAYITEEDNYVTSYGEEKYPTYFIKRIIGIPGDKVTWINGELKINDEIVDETYFDDATKYNASIDKNNFYGTFKYKENGEEKTSLIIPDGYYFILGDNRKVSSDSRYIGLVPKEHIVGVISYKIDKLKIEKVK